jgi:hypothetical protein
MWNWDMWYFTCVFGTCDISHVKLHMSTHVKLCVWHVKFLICNFTCEFGTCEFGTCNFSHVNTCEIMCFTCEVSHVKFHMWIWNMWIWNMWFFTCEHMWNYVFHMWNFTCEISHVRFHMWIWNMWNIISHVKFHMWKITCSKSTCSISHMWIHVEFL